MEKCDKCGEFIEFTRLCPLCAHYEKERLKRSTKKCEERAEKAEALARKLAETLEEVTWLLEGYTGRHEDIERLKKELPKAKEVLGDEQSDFNRTLNRRSEFTLYAVGERSGELHSCSG